ncbi:MAG: hypothetical protein L0H53_15010 [Candidatus Nitrosocosmicus sp.]|nr:hypothetical protein [Candidatus Nitrosocosmicus sp.]MDN5868937.1 hypothetical protein [Candidatus Nitrosocosmicus sp.]
MSQNQVAPFDITVTDNKTKSQAKFYSLNMDSVQNSMGFPFNPKFSFETVGGFVDSGVFLDSPLNINPEFTNDFSNNDNNNNDGSGSGDSDSSSYSQDLDIEIDISKDPIVHGNIQTIIVEVSDDDTNEKISNARVNGEVEYASGSTSNGGQFDKDTESDGEASHSWRISGNANPGIFKVFVEASKSGYDSVSGTESFTVISKDMEENEATNFTDSSNSSFDSESNFTESESGSAIDNSESSRCPDGSHRSPSGDCETVTDTSGMPRCDDGFHRSPDGDCEEVRDNADNDDDNDNGDSNPCTAEQASRDHTCTSSSGDNDDIDDWTDPPVEEDNNESSESDSDSENPTTDSQNDVSESGNNDDRGEEESESEESNNSEDNDSDNESDGEDNVN